MFSLTNNGSHSVKKLFDAQKANFSGQEQKQTEKVIKALVKVLKKNKTLDELEKALMEETFNTKCVTLPRYKNKCKCITFCGLQGVPEYMAHCEQIAFVFFFHIQGAQDNKTLRFFRSISLRHTV